MVHQCKPQKSILPPKNNKPRTAQVGAISKAQKDSKTKTTFSTTGDNKSSQKFFFRNFFEVSGKSHSAEKCKRGDALGFFEHPFCCKISKIYGRNNEKKIGKKSVSQCRKKKESLIVSKKWTLLLWNGFLSHVRGFGCVEKEVLSTYGKSW